METEYLIQQALDAVMDGRTTFVVASRLRTIKNADQILILDKGSIVEHGTHESLLALNGAYTRLYDLQLREQEEFETRMLSNDNKESLVESEDVYEGRGRDKSVPTEGQTAEQKREVTR